MSYAKDHDPHSLRVAQQLIEGLGQPMRRALLTQLLMQGTRPVLELPGCSPQDHAVCSAVWDALVSLRPAAELHLYAAEISARNAASANR